MPWLPKPAASSISWLPKRFLEKKLQKSFNVQDRLWREVRAKEVFNSFTIGCSIVAQGA
jgi:hypothetical protein